MNIENSDMKRRISKKKKKAKDDFLICSESIKDYQGFSGKNKSLSNFSISSGKNKVLRVNLNDCFTFQ